MGQPVTNPESHDQYKAMEPLRLSSGTDGEIRNKRPATSALLFFKVDEGTAYLPCDKKQYTRQNWDDLGYDLRHLLLLDNDRKNILIEGYDRIDKDWVAPTYIIRRHNDQWIVADRLGTPSAEFAQLEEAVSHALTLKEVVDRGPDFSFDFNLLPTLVATITATVLLVSSMTMPVLIGYLNLLIPRPMHWSVELAVVFVCSIVAISFYVLRENMRIVYGWLEISVAVGLIWNAIESVAQQVPTTLDANAEFSFKVMAAIYVFVEGRDNIEKVAKESAAVEKAAMESKKNTRRVEMLAIEGKALLFGYVWPEEVARAALANAERNARKGGSS